MAASTKVRLQLEGKDNTAKAFKSAKKNADSFGASIKTALKIGAVALAAKKSFDLVAGALNDMNVLNDTAQRAGVGTEWLQKFSGAMGQAGIQMQQTDIIGSIQKLNAGLVNTEKLKALQKLGVDVSHLRGLKPEEAFMGFLETVAAIPDEQTRLLALMRGMEEQGLKLAPILRQGPEAMKSSLDAVMEMIPHTSSETVTMATDLNNSFTRVKDAIQNEMWTALGSVLQWGTDAFGRLDIALGVLYERFRLFGKNTVVVFTEVWDSLTGGWERFEESCQAGMAVLEGAMQSLRDRLAASIAKWYGETFQGWDSEQLAAVDEELQELLDKRKALTEAAVAGTTIGANIGLAWEANQAEFEERVGKLTRGFEAKAQLSAFSTPPQLEENVKNAVSKGTKEGLAAGIEAGSYEALKVSLRSAVGGFSLGAATNPTAPVARAATAAVSPSATVTKPITDRLGEVLQTLKSILAQTQSLAGTAKTLEAF